MTDQKSRPSLEDFLDEKKYPIAKVRKAAPASMLYFPSGTRRAAALAGIPDESKEYAKWSYKQMIKNFQLIFSYGVQHIFFPAVLPTNFEEKTDDYREKLWGWVDEGLTGPKALVMYQDFGWRIRYMYVENLPRLKAANERLLSQTPPLHAPTLWIIVIPERGLTLRWMLEKLAQFPAKTPEEAIISLYGEAIPPASLYLGFGKLMVSPEILPPFLIGALHCYWRQQPGYSLNDQQFRSILYDYKYERSTWKADKTGRAEGILSYRTAWEKGPTIGLGKRLGPFWYPIPIQDLATGIIHARDVFKLWFIRLWGILINHK